jgi:hypothetical protein
MPTPGNAVRGQPRERLSDERFERLESPGKGARAMDGEGSERRCDDVTAEAECGQMGAELAVPTTRQEEMRHPLTTWTDPSYAEESLEGLREAYLDYLRGRAKPASSDTVSKYNKVLQSFTRSLVQNGDFPVLGSVTPAAVNRWVNERRARGLSEEGISTHLVALKVFTSKYVYKELELTTADLLRKVSRITAPERPAEVLTAEERERVLACFNQPTYEDTRNVALVACYMVLIPR